MTRRDTPGVGRAARAATTPGPVAPATWPGRLVRRVVWIGALVGALGLAVLLAGGPSPFRKSMTLAAGSDFTITSTISSSPTVQTADLLYPGAPRYLWYTVHNTRAQAITVTSLTTTLDPSFPVPATCPASNLDVSQVNFTGALVVPANGTNTVSRPISLLDTNANQDGCKSVTFHFAYSGSATYSLTYGTTTGLTSSLNPAQLGQSVTFTATVTPVGTPPSGPTGTVTFRDGSTVLAANVPLDANGKATFTTSTLSAGSHSITATYNPSTAPADAGNFATSSGSLTQVVNNFATTTALTSSLNPSTWNQSVTFTATVTASTGAPTGSVTFYDGTTVLAANVPLNAQGKATFTTSNLQPGTHPIKAVYNPTGTYVASTSAVLNQVVNYTSCINGTFPNGYTVASGQWICVTNPTRIAGLVTVQSNAILTILSGSLDGGIDVQPSGTLYVNPGAFINRAATLAAGSTLSTTGGSFLSITGTSMASVRLCGANVSNDVSFSGTTGFVLIGDAGDNGSPTCGQTFVGGNLTLNANTGGFEVGGSRISLSVTAINNSGTGPGGRVGPEIDANQIGGSLNCTGNSPAPSNVGKPNTVSGTRSGQCGAAGF